jgi:hypothetical protein
MTAEQFGVWVDLPMVVEYDITPADRSVGLFDETWEIYSAEIVVGDQKVPVVIDDKDRLIETIADQLANERRKAEVY